MAEKAVKRYGKQILEGLDYLHMNKLIHRDMRVHELLLHVRGGCNDEVWCCWRPLGAAYCSKTTGLFSRYPCNWRHGGMRNYRGTANL